MRRRQHEIPTHLNVEDKLLFGLTARQFLYVLVGLSVSYALWNQLSEAPLALRATVVGAILLVTTRPDAAAPARSATRGVAAGGLRVRGRTAHARRGGRVSRIQAIGDLPPPPGTSSRPI